MPLVAILLWLLVFCVVVFVALWLVRQLPIDPPLQKIAVIVVIVIALLVLAWKFVPGFATMRV
jgi:hypothetical protein